MSSFFPRTCLLVLLVFAAPVLRAQREKIPEEDLEFVEKNFPHAQKTSTGLRYIVQVEGKGDCPQAGDIVRLLYAGRFLDGTIFEQNNDRQHPFTFRLGRNQVIEGWEQIMELMKPGERLIVIIPPEMAYGMRGSPPRIPRNATLVFLIELLDFKHD
jgi:FKBP-type peptidyl-prolyl cis-trans isomerase